MISTCVSNRVEQLAGVNCFDLDSFDDRRGVFTRLYSQSSFDDLLQGHPIQQINHSFNPRMGTVRGMHMQLKPLQEYKVVICLEGEIFDVVVDLRKHSQTLCHWYGRILNPDRQQALIIPPGCAHGFQVLKPRTTLLYLHTAAYASDSEFGMSYFDRKIDIRWPLPISIISQKDLQYPPLDDSFLGFDL